MSFTLFLQPIVKRDVGVEGPVCLQIHVYVPQVLRDIDARQVQPYTLTYFFTQLKQPSCLMS